MSRATGTVNLERSILIQVKHMYRQLARLEEIGRLVSPVPITKAVRTDGESPEMPFTRSRPYI
eukprot:1574326-Amphidinium_carterae.1